MFSSDQQIPFHEPRAFDLWFKVMKWFQPDHVVYAGDMVDHQGLSRWVNGGSREFLNELPQHNINDEAILRKMFEEAKPAREFLEQTRAILPNATGLFAGGNHDMTRVYKYFDQKRPEILEHLTPESLWGVKTLGFDWIEYEDRPRHFAGGLYVHHGVAISKHAGESVKADVENFGVSLIRGHSHRIACVNRSFPLRNNGIGETLSGYEIGHMMDINCSGASYDNVHNWNMGFAVGYIEDGAIDTQDGRRVHIQLIPITRDFTCVVSGKLFKA